MRLIEEIYDTHMVIKDTGHFKTVRHCVPKGIQKLFLCGFELFQIEAHFTSSALMSTFVVSMPT